MTTTTCENPVHRLPMGALLALAMTGFICIVTETLPAGLLPQLAEGLNISRPLAGQLVTAYAIGSLIAAIPLTIATRRWRRRSVLLLTIVGFLIFNTVTALSFNVWLTLLARFFAGVSAGLAWSLLAGYARRMVPDFMQGRAMAVAMVGTPVALSLGVPAGTGRGNLVGWRMAFGVMALLTLGLIVWVLAKVPDYPGESDAKALGLRPVLSTPGVRSILSVVIVWMLAHNILYTYIADFVSLSGLLAHVDVILLVFGLSALVGIGFAGRFVDRWLRLCVLVSLTVFALVALLFALFPVQAMVIYAGVALWGITFGGAATLLQTALADSAGDGADVALSMNVVAWNSAIAGGGIIGGLLLNRWGADSFPRALLILLAAGFCIALAARRHGFRPGARTGTL